MNRIFMFWESVVGNDRVTSVFSNAEGGYILVGVRNDGSIRGLSDTEIQSFNQLVSNTANENVKPPIYPFTEVVKIQDKKIICLYIKKGHSKPYQTDSGHFYTKSGSDKRKISNEELRRLFAINPQRFSKSFYMDCVYFDGNEVNTNRFKFKERVDGPFTEMYRHALLFLKASLPHYQEGNDFNTPGKLEIPEQALSEVIINALVHRDYYIQSSLKRLSGD